MLDTRGGRVAYAAPSSGGFLGIGNKSLAIPWSALTLDTDNQRFRLAASSEQVRSAPGFDKDSWPAMADFAWKVLDQAFEAARTFRPMTAEQVAALVAQVRDHAMEGKFELLEISNYFDTAAKCPDYLGGLTPSVKDLAPGSAT